MQVVTTNQLDNLRDGPPTLWTYNGLDCCVTHELLYKTKHHLDPITAATYEFSRTLQAPVLSMMRRGTLIDDERRQALIGWHHTLITKLESQLKRLIKEGLGEDASEFNWRSPVQLKVLFYEWLRLPEITKNKKPTTDEDALLKLQRFPHAKPFVNHILALRGAGKLVGILSTGLDDDGRMRCTYSIAGTISGRFSSYASPFDKGTNNQNITPDMRYIYIADPGYKMAYIDLEQAESRAVGAKIFALFGDSKYLEACESGDLHTTVALMTWPHLKTKEDVARICVGDFTFRDIAKRLGHATNYLGTPNELALRLQIPANVIVDFQAKYFEAFPGIRRWHQWVIQQINTKGYLISLAGRKRWFRGRTNEDSIIGEAVSYDPQETVARLLNQGMLNVWYHGLIGVSQSQLLMQVHDAIVIQYPEEKEDYELPLALDTITLPVLLRAPNGYTRQFIIPSEAKHGWNWGERYKRDSQGKYDFDPDALIKWEGPGRDKRQRIYNPAIPLLNQPRRQFHFQRHTL